MGSLSSWFVLSSMGFYPVTPGSQYYAIGSPLFGEVRINAGSDKIFVIRAINNSEKNFYIQSAKLNGEKISRTWITQKEIMNGGSLVFEMGPEPNKKWGSAATDSPPSMTKAH
jgi:putative alpha-1,2-mannosidase